MSVEPRHHRGRLFRTSVEKMMYSLDPRKLIRGGKVVNFLVLEQDIWQTQLTEGFDLVYSLTVQSFVAGRAWCRSTSHLHLRRRELWTLNSDLWFSAHCPLSSQSRIVVSTFQVNLPTCVTQSKNFLIDKPITVELNLWVMTPFRKPLTPKQFTLWFITIKG